MAKYYGYNSYSRNDNYSKYNQNRKNYYSNNKQQNTKRSQNYNFQKESNTKKKSIINLKIITFIVLLISLIIIIQFLFEFLIVSNLSIKSIKFETDFSDKTKSEMRKITRIQNNIMYYNVDTKKIEENILLNPIVKSAKVKKIFPNKLYINIKKRDGVVISFIDEKNEDIPLIIDEDGVVFAVGKKDIKDFNLPVLSGVQYKELHKGVKYNRVAKFLKSLSNLKKENYKLFSLLSELRLVPVGDSEEDEKEIEILVYLLNSDIPFRVMPYINEKLIKYMLYVLKALKENEKDFNKIKEIDFRSNPPVYVK